MNDSCPVSSVAATVLLVDDHPIVHEGFRLMCRTMRPMIKLLGAYRYDEAVAQCQAHALDLVLIDINLGAVRSGIDLLKTLRQAEHAFKIAILSAIDDPQTVSECIEAGACGFIFKNISGSALLQALDDILDGKIYLPTHLNRSDDLHRPGPQGCHPSLPPRLTEALYYLCQGLPNKSIARRMNISEGTVRKLYVTELFRRYEVSKRTELIAKLARLGYRIPTPGNAERM